MLKTNLSDIFSDLNSESSVILPKSIKIKNINSVDTVANTTSSFMPQKGAYSDATSSFMPQKGGYSDATSSFMPQKGGYLNGTNNKDIKQLISMLSATSDDNYTANSTDNTEQLKDKLFNIIQSGGVGDLNYFMRYIDMIFNGNNLTINEDEYVRKYKELDENDKQMLQTYYNERKSTGVLKGPQFRQIFKYGLQFLDNIYPQIGNFPKPDYEPITSEGEALLIIAHMVAAYEVSRYDVIKEEYDEATEDIKKIIKEKLRSPTESSNNLIYNQILEIIQSS
jgi:hypothetical protein